MSIKVSDKLLAPSRGTPADVFAFFIKYPPLRPTEAKACVNRAYELSEKTGLDFAIVMSRIGDETGDLNGPGIFKSKIWEDRLNSSGLGVTDGEDDVAAWKDGASSAEATVAHMLLYATGAINKGGLTPSDDPRYAAYLDAYGDKATAKTLKDLEGKWFTQVGGAQNSADRGNAIFPNIPNQGVPVVSSTLNMTKDLIPMPALSQHFILDSQNDSWDDLGQRSVKGIVLHRMLGSLHGTDEYFAEHAPGLTDFGVDCTTGEILQWTDPLGTAHPGVSPNKAPWASGPLQAPYGDGLSFFNKYGINAINRDEFSWEISGEYDDPWSEKSMQVTAQMLAHFAHNYGITWEQFPISPIDGFSFIRWHQEFTIGTGKICPGPVVMNATATLIEMVQAIMKKAQVGGTAIKPSNYAPLNVPAFLKEDIKKGKPTSQVWKGVQLHALVGEYTALHGVKRLQVASVKPGTPLVGPSLKPGQTFMAWYWFISDGKTWLLTPYGERILANSVSPRIVVKIPPKKKKKPVTPVHHG